MERLANTSGFYEMGVYSFYMLHHYSHMMKSEKYKPGETLMPNSSNDSEKWSGIIFLSFTYALYIITVTAPIGFVISAIKVYRFKKFAEKSAEPPDQDVVLIATHYEWLERTFIFMAVMMMAAAGLVYYFVGFIVGGVAVVWWFYRIIRGARALIARKPLPAVICTKALCYGQAESSV